MTYEVEESSTGFLNFERIAVRMIGKERIDIKMIEIHFVIFGAENISARFLSLTSLHLAARTLNYKVIVD